MPRLRKHFVLISGVFLCVVLLALIHRQSANDCPDRHSSSSNYSLYEQFCHQVEERIAAESSSNVSNQTISSGKPIPYSYSQWKTAELMPRVLTRCEHAIYIHLLSILVEHVFNKYHIPYMMMAATLLGSYTHHDILPWDDDIDLRVPISHRSQLQSIVLQELSASPYNIVIIQMHNERNYDKIFFSWCPFAGQLPWRFPFIDIFYHDQNDTHVWLVSEPATCPERREDVYPFVLRPLGPLWVFGPREPMAHFEARKMIQIETGCYMFPYSHKHEKLLRPDILYANCFELNSFYPYVKRNCGNHECRETLKLGNDRVIHQVTYNYTYRTYLYSEINSSFKAC